MAGCSGMTLKVSVAPMPTSMGVPRCRLGTPGGDASGGDVDLGHAGLASAPLMGKSGLGAPGGAPRMGASVILLPPQPNTTLLHEMILSPARSSRRRRVGRQRTRPGTATQLAHPCRFPLEDLTGALRLIQACTTFAEELDAFGGECNGRSVMLGVTLGDELLEIALRPRQDLIGRTCRFHRAVQFGRLSGFPTFRRLCLRASGAAFSGPIHSSIRCEPGYFRNIFLAPSCSLTLSLTE